MKRLPYAWRVELRRAERWLCNTVGRQTFARSRTEVTDLYPHALVTHSSKLLRQVAPDLMPLQENKIINLRLACAKLDRLLIRPGETFSFCSLVGRTTRRRGYLDGLEIHEGKMVGSTGGGLCQLANLLYWMAINLDLDIIERHHHAVDLFPDDERNVPFGMGATVFYNYIDLRFRNTLEQPLLLRLSVDPPVLQGSMYSDRAKPFDVEIFETQRRFIRTADGFVLRENRVAKRIVYCDGRKPIEAEIAHNVGRVCYEVQEDLIQPATSPPLER